ncbi:MAG: CHAT domain-containing protein [Dysgonamonadaceae bacterium]|jgi:CHAT domain-containing protein/tetratricopeptide (TPR) repeat protein|nr:CHAT domain-containing protein [Dysgonamonadaceae bacterium]
MKRVTLLFVLLCFVAVGFAQNAKELAETKNLAMDYLNADNYPKFLETQILVTDMTKKIYGEQNQKYATELFKLAIGYSINKEYSKAVQAGEEAAAMQKKKLGENSPEYLQTLENLVPDYSLTKNHSKAIETSNYLVETVKKTKGEQSAKYAKQLSLLASTYRYNKEYNKAIEIAETAAAIQRKTDVGKNLIATLQLLEWCYTFGDYQKAVSICDEIVSLIYQSGKISEYFDTYIPSCIMTYTMGGMYEKAEKVIINLQNFVSKQYGEQSSEYADMLGYKANYYDAIGEYVNAIETKKKMLNIIRNKTDKYIEGLMSLAISYKSINDWKQGELLGMEALNLAKSYFGENSVDYLNVLQSVRLENKYQALEKAKEARALSDKLFKNEKNNRIHIYSINNLARQYSRVNDFENALKQRNEAIALQGENYFSLNLDLTMKCYYLTALAVINNRPELLPQAVEIGKTAFKYMERHINNANRNVLQAFLEPLYAAYFYGDSIEVAARLYQQEFDIIQGKITNNFRNMTAVERNTIWTSGNNQKITTDYPYTFSLLSGGYPLFLDLAYNGAVFSKGLLLNSELSLHSMILESGDTDIINLFTQLKLQDAQLNLMYKQPEELQNQTLIDTLKQKSQNLERELMRRSQIYGDYTRNLTLKWQDVQNSLSGTDIAIEFVDFNPTIFDTIVPNTRTYAALLLKKDWEHPKMVQLFRQGELDSLALDGNSKLFKDIDMEKDQNRIYESAALGNMIWSPLEEYLQDVKNIYFAPSGVLHQLAIEYLPASKGDMQKRYNLYRLSSTRQLAIKKLENEQDKTVLYGGLDYDGNTNNPLLAAADKNEYLEEIKMRKVIGELSLSDIHAAPLAYTAQEIEQIGGMLSEKGFMPIVFSGKEGTESSFRELSGQKVKRLHIATHGFYLPEDETKNNNTSKEDLSLNRSGLLMAGANVALSNENVQSMANDGILTAKEIAQTDLRGLDLVVLSACQTGLGEVTGEGVFGLQRGFKKAGAQTLLMSLWSVSDEATAIMMSRFYEHLLAGKSKREAFMSAQNDLRNYEKNGQKIFDKPQFWAAFILLDA